MFQDPIPDYKPELEKVANPREVPTETMGIRVGSSVIDTDALYRYAQLGATNVELAEIFGTSESQIRYYFTSYIQKARTSLKMRLRRAQLKVAIENESVPMLIWLGKNILNQTDQPLSEESEQVLPWIVNETDDATK